MFKKSLPFKPKAIKHDFTFLSLVAAFLIFGILMIYNSTAVYAQENLGEAYRLVLLQVGWILVGLFGFNFFYRIDYHKLRSAALPMFLFAIFFLSMLALVSLFSSCESSSVSFSPCVNGAHRWFYLNPAPFPPFPFLGVVGFQPSEFAKLALIIYLAVIIEKSLKERTNPFFVFVVTTGLVSSLVLLQPNMSTATLLFIIGLGMYFASGAPIKPLLFLIPSVLIMCVLFVFSSSYRRARLLTFLGSASVGGAELSLGYHIKQIQIALGSGGLFGLGFGQSKQKFQYLPEVAADSIFAIIGEEFGFVGTTIFIVLFSFLIYKGFQIAQNSPDLFGKLLSVGIVIWLAGQFFVNIAAMTRIIPLTGVPLPLVSYGGSSTVFSLMALGLLGNISSRVG